MTTQPQSTKGGLTTTYKHVDGDEGFVMPDKVGLAIYGDEAKSLQKGDFASLVSYFVWNTDVDNPSEYMRQLAAERRKYYNDSETVMTYEYLRVKVEHPELRRHIIGLDLEAERHKDGSIYETLWFGEDTRIETDAEGLIISLNAVVKR